MSVKIRKKTSYVWKKNYILNPSTGTCESCKIFLKYYWQFSNYVWWSCKSNKNLFNKSYSYKNNCNKSCSNSNCYNKFYVLLAFLLSTIEVLIAVSIYYCFIKHRPKQTNLLPCRDTSNKLKEININDIIWK